MRTASPRYEECSRAQVKEPHSRAVPGAARGWHYKALKAWSPKPLVLKV